MDLIHTLFRTKCTFREGVGMSTPAPTSCWPPHGLCLLNTPSQHGTSAPREVALLSPQGSQSATRAINRFFVAIADVLGSLLPTAGGGSPSPHHRRLELLLSPQLPQWPKPGQWTPDHQALGPAPPRAATDRLRNQEACPCPSVNLSFFICVTRGVDSKLIPEG